MKRASCMVLFGAAVLGAVPARASAIVDLLHQFADVQSVALDATVWYLDGAGVSCGPAGLPIPGDFVYSANGSGWRMRSRLDATLAPFLNHETAFDGGWLQTYDKHQDTLGVLVGSDAVSRAPHIPNPFFAAMQFIVPLTEDTEDQFERLGAMKAIAAAPRSEPVWEPVPGIGEPTERAVFPGAVYDGHPYTYVVYATNGDRAAPTSIERVGADGRVLSRVVLGKWVETDAGGGVTHRWPRVVMMEAFGPAGSTGSVRLVYSIASLEINNPDRLQGETWRIGWAQPTRVWMNPPGALMKP